MKLEAITTPDGVKVQLQFDGTAEVIGYAEERARLGYLTVRIPEKVSGHPVTAIRAGAFPTGREWDLYIPKTVTKIGSLPENYSEKRSVPPTHFLKEMGPAFDNPNFHYSPATVNWNCHVKIRVEAGSYAQRYCEQHNISYRIEVVKGRAENFETEMAAEGKTQIEYEYILDTKQDAWLRKYMGAQTVVQVPDTIDGHKVTAIYVSCFESSPVTRVQIPEGVKILYGGAFQNCENLTEVILPDSLTEIYSFAFRYCPVLKSVRLPGSLPRFNNHVFDGCHQLADIVEKDCMVFKLYEDGTAAVLYYNCAPYMALKIEIPESIGAHKVTAIAPEAFAAYGEINRLFVPASVVQIGRKALPAGRQIVHLTAGSYAESWCREHSIPYTVE